MADNKPHDREAVKLQELDPAELDAVGGGKPSTTLGSGKTSSLQVGPAPEKPIDSGSTTTTQI